MTPVRMEVVVGDSVTSVRMEVGEVGSWVAPVRIEVGYVGT